MHYIWMLIVGLVVGALAKLIMPGKDPGGIIVTMLLGVAGSFIAGIIGRAVGWYAAEDRLAEPHDSKPSGCAVGEARFDQ